MKILLLVVALTTLAQVFPSCEQQPGELRVIGWVEAKRFDRVSDVYVITINHAEYDVPSYFWHDVKIGDLVKWDGTTWTVVRRAADGVLFIGTIAPARPRSV